MHKDNKINNLRETILSEKQRKPQKTIRNPRKFKQFSASHAYLCKYWHRKMGSRVSQCGRVKAASITGLRQPANSPTPRSGRQLAAFHPKTGRFGLKNSAFWT